MLKTASLLTVTLLSILNFSLITILFVLVLYPAVFIHTVCNMCFDSQALVLTAAKKKKRTKNYTPGRGKIVPRNITFLVGEKLCRVM